MIAFIMRKFYFRVRSVDAAHQWCSIELEERQMGLNYVSSSLAPILPRSSGFSFFIFHHLLKMNAILRKFLSLLG